MTSYEEYYVSQSRRDNKTQIHWKQTPFGLRPHVEGREIAWAPQEGGQRVFLECPATEVLFHGPRGNGKMIKNSYPVPTPNGFVPHGDLKPGDFVFNRYGRAVQVLGTENHYNQKIWEVKLRDGARVPCGKDHLWVTTQGVKKTHQLDAAKDKMCVNEEPVEQGEADLPTDPYLMGLLIGDGCFDAVWHPRTGHQHKRVRFYTGDRQLRDYVVNKFGFSLTKGEENCYHTGITRKSHKGARDYLFTLIPEDPKAPRYQATTKYIPEIFMLGSIQQRWDLLQGLMDTDGHTSGPARATYCTVSEQLALDVSRLAKGLGFCTFIRQHDGTRSPVYRVGMRTTPNKMLHPFCRMDYKNKARSKRPGHFKERYTEIVSVEKTKEVADCTCIKVEEGEYLVGKDFTLTHNSDALLASYIAHVGKGYRHHWKGAIFRTTFPSLEDIIRKAKNMYLDVFPGAEYNTSKSMFTFPDGEELKFRMLEDPADFDKYRGHEYTYLGFEELTGWKDSILPLSMMSCLRSPIPSIPKLFRASTNPDGPGHAWVKERYGLGGKDNQGKRRIVTRRKGISGYEEVVAIHGALHENKVLLEADPNYIDRVYASCRGDKNKIAAWVHGNWDIVGGGLFADVWNPGVHVVPWFPPSYIPHGWTVNRSYDHGDSSPFSVGWWAESNGEPVVYQGVRYGTVRGDLYRINEWYGCSGAPNEGLSMPTEEIARGIFTREAEMGIYDRVSHEANPADNSIFTSSPDIITPAEIMAKCGIHWEPCIKYSGSREHGWQAMRAMLARSTDPNRTERGLFVTDRCNDFIRVLPSLQRDQRKPDDVGKGAEDHIADETRYRISQYGGRIVVRH